MQEEANPRKILRRAPDYGASTLPISFSRFGSRHTAVAKLAPSRTFRSLESSQSVPQLSKSIASETESKTHVTHSKQTTATQINRYFLTSFSRSAGRLLPLAEHRRSERFFPAAAARA
jgi:hypothetical protein